MVKTLTLCMVRTETHMLLGLKKMGMGQGWWNSFGGKVGLGETVEEAARRELKEECGLEADALESRGLMIVENATSPVVLHIHLFEAVAWHGEPSESDEMRPAWFRLTEIPYHQMWANDRHWIPVFLEGQNVHATFRFLDDETLLDVSFHKESTYSTL